MEGTCSVLEARLHLSCSHGRTSAAPLFFCVHPVLYPGPSAARQTFLTFLKHMLYLEHCQTGNCRGNVKTFQETRGASLIKANSTFTLMTEANICSEISRHFY